MARECGVYGFAIPWFPVMLTGFCFSRKNQWRGRENVKENNNLTINIMREKTDSIRYPRLTSADIKTGLD